MSPRSLFDPAGFLTKEDAQALTKRVLAMAKAEQTRVTLLGSARGNTRYAVNQVSSGGDNTNVTVQIRSVFGTKSASTTTNKLDDASLKAAVDMSERLARLGPDDPEAMRELDPQTYDESPGWSSITESLDPAGRAAAVRAVTEPSRAAKLAATGYIESDAQAHAIANSTGLFAYGKQTAAAMTTTVRATDGSSSGWAGAAHTDRSNIDPEARGARAIEKAHAWMPPVAPDSARHTAVLEPPAGRTLARTPALARTAPRAGARGGRVPHTAGGD